MKRVGGIIGPHVAVTEKPACWESRSASMVTTTYGLGSADGFNERGLEVDLLY
jgi:penicillin V acylase-like amidase (Ntn superfamily)